MCRWIRNRLQIIRFTVKHWAQSPLTNDPASLDSIMEDNNGIEVIHICQQSYFSGASGSAEVRDSFVSDRENISLYRFELIIYISSDFYSLSGWNGPQVNPPSNSQAAFASFMIGCQPVTWRWVSCLMNEVCHHVKSSGYCRTTEDEQQNKVCDVM